MARKIHRFETVDSTMARAAQLVTRGAPSGTVVIADEQTEGQGRHGHSWHSEKGAGLYMSQILRLKICPDSLPLVTLVAGLATAEAITKVAGIPCDLRWPNDVLIGEKKVAGILVYLHDGALILGIGVNVNHISFPDDLAAIATSLRIATGQSYSREELLEVLIGSIDAHLETLFHSGKDAILNAFAGASSYVRGRRVSVDLGENTIEGTTDGLNPQGFLILRRDNGRQTLIFAGGVRPVCS